MQGRTLALVVFFLTGCATRGEPVLNSAPINVANDELADYWVPRETKVSIFTPSNGTSCGVVDFRFLIDSNGDVHEVEVIDALPKGTFNRAAIDMAEAYKFVPSESNSQRIPVRVTRYVTFDMNPTDDVDCSEVVKQIRSGRTE
jgi:TonB family protein